MSTTDGARPASGWWATVRLALVLIALCGGAYPALTTWVGGELFPRQAFGSLIERGGVAVGSALVGQPFTDPGYFHGRPSACGYDPFHVAGSNLAPGNPALRERARETARALAASDGAVPGAIPVDLIAASGSGIDPHISPAAARLQIPRIARARGLGPAVLEALLDRYVQNATFGVLGQPRVNVLNLNLALDRASGAGVATPRL